MADETPASAMSVLSAPLEPMPAAGDPSWRIPSALRAPAGPEREAAVEAEVAGLAVDTLVPGLRAHLAGCPACAEEHDGLRAVLELDTGA